MESEVKWFCERYKLFELMQEQPNWPLRQYARELKHDLKWVRKWVARFRQAEQVDFKSFCSQSRAPKKVPQGISEQAKDIIVQLREDLSEEFHRKASAETILFGIERLKKQEVLEVQMPRSSSSIQRVLKERGLILPRQARWRDPSSCQGQWKNGKLTLEKSALTGNTSLSFSEWQIGGLPARFTLKAAMATVLKAL